MRSLDLWWPHVREARWFQGKGRDGRLTAVTPLPWLVAPPAGVAVRPEVARVTYPDGSAELYQLLVGYRSTPPADVDPVGVTDGLWVVDAPRDPDAVSALTQALTEPRTWGDGASTLEVAVVSPVPDGDLTSRWYTGQQSNTTVFLGDVALLKVFRKLEPGANLDVVVTRRLRDAGVTDVPAVHGWLSATVDGARYDLVACAEQLRDPTDGWELACDSCRTGGDFSDHAAALGRALAHVHQALSAGAGTVPGAVVADQMTERLAAAAAAAATLAPYVPELRRRADALRSRDIAVQTVHGDFHLGQTLLTPDGWRIIDFEGEPLKSMAERVRPDSPWRDVAGMTRSLAYATSAHADPFGQVATTWLSRARDAFLRAYCGQQTQVDEDLLSAYEADKAAYEVVYETRNRPDWVQIPLRAIHHVAPPATRDEGK